MNDVEPNEIDLTSSINEKEDSNIIENGTIIGEESSREQEIENQDMMK